MQKWGLKYRPLKLDHVLGQEYSKDMIRGMLLSSERPDAWLFTGPFGSGKTSTARILAKCFLCLNPDLHGQSCNQCPECQAVDNIEQGSQSLNYIEMDAPSVGNVKTIRDLIDDARLSPVNGAPHRVIYLDEVHSLSKDAQNVLLKTLEEGVGRTIFLMATTDPEKLLATMRSRCMSIVLAPIERKVVVDYLRWVVQQEGRTADDSALELIAEYNYGHMRDVLNMAYQISLAGPITLDVVKKQLNLHLDEHAALLAVQLTDSWEHTLASIDKLTQEFSPAELWHAVGRSLGQAYLTVIQPTRNTSEWIKILAERHGSRLASLAEWSLGEGARLQVRFRLDLMVGLALVREKLGVTGSTVPVKDKKIGIPKSEMRNQGVFRSIPPLSEERVVSLFDLKPVDVPATSGNHSNHVESPVHGKL
jgi:DNA polymerase III subunit gamma/tau